MEDRGCIAPSAGYIISPGLVFCYCPSAFSRFLLVRGPARQLMDIALGRPDGHDSRGLDETACLLRRGAWLGAVSIFFKFNCRG